MSLVLIRKALEKRLGTLTPAISTAHEGVSFKPVAGIPYQRTQVVPFEPLNPTLGDDHFREQGEFQIYLCYPSNQGLADVTTQAELVKNHFKRGTTLTEGAIEVLITRTPQITGSLPLGDRVVVPVLIKYSVEMFL